MASDVNCVAYPPAVVSTVAVAWLAWQLWQLPKRGTSPRTRDGGQSPHSSRRIDGVMGAQPRPLRELVLQNQTRSWRDHSNGIMRQVPSGCLVKNACVPPP